MIFGTLYGSVFGFEDILPGFKILEGSHVTTLLILSDALYFRAVAQPGAAISLVSVFRRSSVVVAFLAGGLLYRDRNLRRKGLALLLVLSGAILAALG